MLTPCNTSMVPYAARMSSSSSAAPGVGLVWAGGSASEAVAARLSAPFGEVPGEPLGDAPDWPTTSASSAVTSRSSASCSSGTGCSSSPSPRYGGAHERVGLYLLRVTEGDETPEVEDVDVVAGAHDEAHVVLDEQHAEAGRGELVEQLGELIGLGLVQTRRRLVEEDDLRLRRERPGELDEPLGPGRTACRPARPTPT